METKIIDYGMNGEGVAKVDGKVLLISGALIDEIVDCEIVEDFGNYAVCKLNKVISPSEMRQTPPCPFFNECGGCALQHMKYTEQRKFKSLNVQKTIKKITGINFSVNQTVGCSSAFNYRNKMSFSTKNGNCGLLKFSSSDIVNIDACLLADEKINAILKLFKVFIKTNKTSSIKNLVVRVIANQTLIGVVATEHVELIPFYETLNKQFKNIGLFEIINTRKDSVVLSGKVKHIAGIEEINITQTNTNSTKTLNYSVDLLGFHQTNIEIQNKLYESVLKYIKSSSVVVNGFSGQGLLSAIIAQKAKHVVGIEINKSSHLSAEKLKTDNKIKNLTNICGDFFKHIKDYVKNADTIILDPTKKGCGKNVMNEIAGIKNIIYISCNPIALSKDLNIIKDKYDIEEITPFDMFPNTTSVETLVKLNLKN
jgi:23S rRNA (uracil1939-C5)-methyltransferase